MEPTVQYAMAAALLGMVIAFVLFLPTSLAQWLRKKNYQYEVTFSLYMLTPTEKFVFNSILFLTTSMFTIGCILYLPNHLATVSRRVYYYFAGDVDITSRNVAVQLGETASKASEAMIGAATDLADAAYKATINTAAAAQAAAERTVERLGFS